MRFISFCKHAFLETWTSRRAILLRGFVALCLESNRPSVLSAARLPCACMPLRCSWHASCCGCGCPRRPLSLHCLELRPIPLGLGGVLDCVLACQLETCGAVRLRHRPYCHSAVQFVSFGVSMWSGVLSCSSLFFSVAAMSLTAEPCAAQHAVAAAAKAQIQTADASWCLLTTTSSRKLRCGPLCILDVSISSDFCLPVSLPFQPFPSSPKWHQ